MRLASCTGRPPRGEHPTRTTRRFLYNIYGVASGAWASRAPRSKQVSHRFCTPRESTPPSRGETANEPWPRNGKENGRTRRSPQLESRRQKAKSLLGRVREVLLRRAKPQKGRAEAEVSVVVGDFEERPRVGRGAQDAHSRLEPHRGAALAHAGQGRSGLEPLNLVE